MYIHLYALFQKLDITIAIIMPDDKHRKGGLSVKLELQNGYLDISTDVLTAISGYAATSCFGVKGMAAASVSDGIVRMLRKENISRGVKVTTGQDGLIDTIELHIIVRHGVNISAVCRSIMSEVRYVVENLTGLKVKNVDVCVDSITAD